MAGTFGSQLEQQQAQQEQGRLNRTQRLLLNKRQAQANAPQMTEEQYYAQAKEKAYIDAKANLNQRIASKRAEIQNLDNVIQDQMDMLNRERDPQARRGIYETINSLNRDKYLATGELNNIQSANSYSQDQLINAYYSGGLDRLQKEAQIEITQQRFAEEHPTKVDTTGMVKVGDAYYPQYWTNAQIEQAQKNPNKMYIENGEREVNNAIAKWEQTNPTEKVIMSKGIVVGVTSGYLKKSLSIEDYNAEMERLASVMPLQAEYNPFTMQFKSSEGYSFYNKNKLNLEYNTLITPQGDLIKNPTKYFEENKIPFDANAPPLPLFRIVDNKIQIKNLSYYENIKTPITTADFNKYLKERNVSNADQRYTPNIDASGDIVGYYDTQLQSGAVSPVLTEEGLMLVAGGVGGAIKWGAVKGGAILLSPLITMATQKTISTILPFNDPSSQILRGGLFLASTPLTGTAFSYQISKDIIIHPKETAIGFKEWAKTSPFEVGTIVLGGGIKLDMKLPKMMNLGDIKVEGTAQQWGMVGDLKGKVNLKEMVGEKGQFKVRYESPLPFIKIGSLKASGMPEVGLGEGFRKEIAKVTTKAGAYIEGATSLEAKYGVKLFREGVDLDVALSDAKKIPELSRNIEQKLKDLKIDYTADEFLNSPINPTGSPMSFINPKTGKSIVEIHLRKPNVKTVMIDGLLFRDPLGVILDKQNILRMIKKGEKMPESKILKTERDIDLIKNAEEFVNKDRTILRQLYLKLGENRIVNLIGWGEKGLVFGTPKSKNLPSIKYVKTIKDLEGGIPELSKGNIESMPQSAFETKILTDPAIMKEIFKGSSTSELDIEKIMILKERRKALYEQKSAFIEGWEKKTKILTEEELKFTLDFARENKNMFEYIYGSLMDISSMPKELNVEGIPKIIKREANDVEFHLKSEEQAKTWIKFEEQAKAKGFDLKFKGEDGYGIWKGKEKAIELKFEGDPDSILGATGERYGYKTERMLNKIEKIKAQTQFNQFIKKSGTATSWWKEQQKGEFVNIVEPPLHRAKDVTDVYREIISLGESYKKLKPFKERLMKRGAKSIEGAKRLREIYETGYEGKEISPNRKKLVDEIKKMFKEDLPVEKVDITENVLGKTKNFEISNKLIKSISKLQMKNMQSPMLEKSSLRQSRSVQSAISSILSMSASASKSASKSASSYASVSKSVSASAYSYDSYSPSPSPSPSKSPSPSPYTSPSPYPYPYPFKSPSPRKSPSPPSKLITKIKRMRKFKVTPEIEALFPDFTARALGLAPKKVSGVEGALREIRKLQTGFEIRRGARVKGYSPIDEKSLLRGMMK